jgi:hypothetical protein
MEQSGRSQEPSTDYRGPYVAMAVLCRQVLQETDGSLSIIRVVHRLTHTVIGPDPPPTLPPFSAEFSAVIALQAGSARGRATIQFRPESPAGIKQQGQYYDVFFEGEERGINLVISPLHLVLDLEGLYWFDVLVENRLLTRIPLRVIYQRVAQQT